MGNYTFIFLGGGGGSKILEEAGKLEILQQMFRKFYISNRLQNRYFPKIVVGCPCCLFRKFHRSKKTANLNYHMLIKKSQAILKRFIDLKFSVGLRWAQKTKPCFVTLRTFFTSTAG